MLIHYTLVFGLLSYIIITNIEMTQRKAWDRGSGFGKLCSPTKTEISEKIKKRCRNHLFC